MKKKGRDMRKRAGVKKKILGPAVYGSEDSGNELLDDVCDAKASYRGGVVEGERWYADCIILHISRTNIPPLLKPSVAQ